MTTEQPEQQPQPAQEQQQQHEQQPEQPVQEQQQDEQPKHQQHKQPQQKPLRVWLSWSSGKDCAYALYTLGKRAGVEVVGLMTTTNERFERVAMHAVRCQLLREQAAAVGLPVYEIKLPFPCSNADYEQRMSGAIAAAKEAGIDAICFGDLFLENVRAYREKMMAPTGIATMFPLWLPGSGKTTTQLASEMMAAGFKAVLVCLDPKKMPASLAGRVWDEQLLSELPADVDPCGENGEFHTFVTEGPIFSQPLSVKVGRAINRDGFVFCDVLPQDYDEAAAEAEAVAAEAEAAAAAAARQASAAAAEEEEVNCLELMKAANPPPCPMDKSTLH